MSKVEEYYKLLTQMGNCENVCHSVCSSCTICKIVEKMYLELCEELGEDNF